MPAKESEGFAEIAELSDIEKVKEVIRNKYGFEVSDRYAADLIDFVSQMRDESITVSMVNFITELS